ncbi:MAG: hypothetical protein EA411_11595 [Saprospirales bacterium]|nr:MAG: hypothetical protein EA411_11595 [Saprospirales bacterium]
MKSKCTFGNSAAGFPAIKHFFFIPFLLFVISVTPGTIHGQQCPVPVPISVQEIDTESAIVNWFLPGTADSFELNYRLVDEDFPHPPQITGITENSATLENLFSGGLYEYRIRAVCGGQPGNWSPLRRFTTNLANPTRCALYLPIGDNNCGSGGNTFVIKVDNYSGMNLGENIFISEIQMIVPHTWPADLQIFLRNPAGREIALTKDNGIGGDNYGDPNSENCSDATIFSDQACVSIGQATPPFIGSFLPEEPLAELHDSSTANGNWELFICDKAPGDVGSLLFFNIVFEEAQCPPPTGIQVSEIDASGFTLDYDPGPDCDSLLVLIGNPGFSPYPPGDSAYQADTTIAIGCSPEHQIRIEGLSAGTDYEIYLLSKCGSVTSAISCPTLFSTLCADPTLRSVFSDEQTCQLVCNISCPMSGLWRNKIGQGSNWSIYEGPTPAPGSGPQAAFSGSGNYLVYSPAGLQCQAPASAILESACIDIDSTGGICDMSFQYHMWGVHIGSLDLLISIDGGFQWDTLWSQKGQVADQWMEAEIDLGPYHGSTGQFRLIATGGEGPIGDIAVDEIVLFNAFLADTSQLIYYVDNDGDGYGQDGTGTFFCTNEAPDGWADQDGDCDDEDPNINPGAEVIPCNLIDENCTGLEDDQPADNPMIDSLVFLQNESCPGGEDGAIQIEMSGGHPPYTIEWNHGDTGRHIQNLETGIYFATVTDSAGCLFRTQFFELEKEQEMSFTFTEVVRPGCSSFEDGSLKILTGGGTPPFEYHWNNGADSAHLHNLPEGHYRVTVIDASGCEFVSPEFHLRAQNPFSIQVTEKISPRCQGESNGSLRIQTNGSGVLKDIQWSHGDTTAHIENLHAGYYSVEVTDSTGCTVALDSIQLSEPEKLSVDFTSIEPPICPGSSGGRILTELHGGSFPYTFFWQRGNNTYTTSDLINVRAGDYFLRVTDQNGCTFEANITLPGPEPFTTILFDKQNVTCGNRSDGSLEVEVTGGNGPHQIFWNSGATDTTSISNLEPGFYRFTLTDQAGCKFTSREFHIDNDQKPLDIQINVLNEIACHGGEDAIMEAVVNSPYIPYRYQWSHLPIYLSDHPRDTLKNLGPNVYSLQVQDATGCVGSPPNTVISEPPELIISEIITTQPTCHGEADGSIMINTLGGTPPLSFSWSHSNTATGKEAENLMAGTYSVTATDQNGCSRERRDIKLNDPPPFSATFETTGDDGTQSGFIAINPGGGIPPYFFLWNPHEGNLINDTIFNLPHGEYEILVFDDNACLVSDTIYVELINRVDASRSDGIQLFPNPTTGAVWIDASNLPTTGKKAHIRLLSKSGEEMKTRSEVLNPGYRIELNLGQFPKAPYLLTIEIPGENTWNRWVVLQ